MLTGLLPPPLLGSSVPTKLLVFDLSSMPTLYVSCELIIDERTVRCKLGCDYLTPLKLFLSSDSVLPISNELFRKLRYACCSRSIESYRVILYS